MTGRQLAGSRPFACLATPLSSEPFPPPPNTFLHVLAGATRRPFIRSQTAGLGGASASRHLSLRLRLQPPRAAHPKLPKASVWATRFPRPAPSTHPPRRAASCPPWSRGLRDAGRPRPPSPPRPPRPLTRRAASSHPRRRHRCHLGAAQAFPGSRGPVRQTLRLPPGPLQKPFPARLRWSQLCAP